MADFSKQYCEKYDPELPWDFDIEEEAKELKEGESMSMICEGFGCMAIAKHEGDILLGFFKFKEPHEMRWIPLDNVTDKTHRDIFKTQEGWIHL